MAIVQWAPGFDGYQGKYIGSAFGVGVTGDLLMRNPNASNKYVAYKIQKSYTWGSVQRFYKTLPQSVKDTLRLCAARNPYVNSRGEVRYANLYHKWLQQQVYAYQVTGAIMEQPPAAHASEPADWTVDSVVAYIEQVPVGIRLYIGILSHYSYIPPLGATFGFVYISRAVSAGVTRYTGNWLYVGAARLYEPYQERVLFPNLANGRYEVGDRIFIRFDTIDITTGFIGTVQMETAIII